MAFQLSPGVLVTEKDLTSVVPAVATTAGGFVGHFAWGPVDQVTTIDSENALVTTFGKPTGTNFESWFTAANFLSYGNNLQVIRVVDKSTNKNAMANAAATAVAITNEDVYQATYSGGGTGLGEWVAKYPGTLGNSLKVSMADANTFSTWAYASNFDTAPLTSTYVSDKGGSFDEIHIAVIDEDGAFTGVNGTVLEKFAYLSKASDAKKPDGTIAFYKNAINDQSKYIWWAAHTANVAGSGTAWGSTANASLFANLTSNVTVSLSGGTIAAPTDGNIQSGLAVFANSEAYDVSLIPLADASATVATYAINSVAEARKDAIVFVSPTKANVVNNVGSEATSIVAFRNSLPSSSYAVLDSGWKYQYDRYNDIYRWVPLNGDTAGLAVRTDFVADPWFSPAGFNRGQVKNVVKLAYSPSATDRDALYKAGVNPVVTFPGNGTVLYGDKTLLSKPSAFDRINVRRLFIVLEKAIATAAKFQLFEFNDPFTRAQFRNLVEPFLRDVQGRRGITDFKVVCDESNNTAQVIDTNNFVADIYIKPARAINFIQLNFIATRSGISFEEVGA
ncbi:tail sheath protein [uncultured Caudovirales phage]|uniref:Tail sheath protein n=1 Tax=uncultured Caudovirales phage TaxID=2100421 RepID=A0A6J7WYF9_9CAUD|nr:tail sheath protein [uncultured Caudovirales phage]